MIKIGLRVPGEHTSRIYRLPVEFTSPEAIRDIVKDEVPKANPILILVPPCETEAAIAA